MCCWTLRCSVAIKRCFRWNIQRTCTYSAVIITLLHITLVEKYADVSSLGEDDNENKQIGDEHSFPEYCARHPKTLRGLSKIDKFSESQSIKETKLANPDTHPGGWWKPASCKHRQSIAIIVPYRNRQHNLKQFLAHMHPFLQRQQRHYRIYFVEQAGTGPFNRGRLLNVGAREAQKDQDWDCFIFHDVDLLPENDHNMYGCGDNPRHFSAFTDERRYRLYKLNVGGVLGFSKEHLKVTNGFSNMYWGWGSEDDDLAQRMQNSGYHVSRPPGVTGRYKMLVHVAQKLGSNRMGAYAHWRERWPTDGMNSLHTLNYSVLARRNHDLYTNITVNLGPRIAHRPISFLESLTDIIFFLRNA